MLFEFRLHPYAGIILNRFYGFVLSRRLLSGSTPEAYTKLDDIKHRCKHFVHKAPFLIFASRSRAAVARWAHNPKVGSSILPFATRSAPGRIFSSNGPLMRSGFINFFGRPNAGKSTLLNFLLGEKLAIVSPKVQTTRHRIKGILTTEDYQMVFSDTPGIIDPKYPLHKRMMEAVRTALEDADLALLLVDVGSDLSESDQIFFQLKLNAPAWVLVTQSDKVGAADVEKAVQYFQGKSYAQKVLSVSAQRKADKTTLLKEMAAALPEGPLYFPADEISDAQTRFFASELIREKIFELTSEEIPYHTTVVVREFQEKTTLTKIVADIVVHRESQKAILLGERGAMIKKLGTAARESIEQFIGRKVFLELFVKVRPKWRESELFLDEYGY